MLHFLKFIELKSLIVFLLIYPCFDIFAQKVNNKSIDFSGYSLLKINAGSSFNEDSAGKYGLEVISNDKSGQSIIAVVNRNSRELLIQKKINFEILIKNYEEYLSENLSSVKRNNNSKELSDALLGEKYFNLGSMSGYFKLEEIYENFDRMTNIFPQYHIQKDTIGYSFEKHPILAYTFSPGNTGKPQTLFTSLHHAREPGSATTLIYFFWKLLEKASQGNPEEEFLLSNRRISVIPVVNPDGYYFNQKNYPNGGGMWRKNRRKINDSTYGVDINRNYGPLQFWDSKNEGSSTTPWNDTYRGDSAFSEPETRAIRDFCIKNKFKTALNYHTFSNCLIYPSSATSSETSDSLTYRLFSLDNSYRSHYSFGLDFQNVGYFARGVSDDWMYLESPMKPKILSFTCEVGSQSASTEYSGFWQSRDSILVQAITNYPINMQILFSANFNLRPVEVYFNCGNNCTSPSVVVRVANIGVNASDMLSGIAVHSLDTSISVTNPDVNLPSLSSGNTVELAFNVSYPKKFFNGKYIPFEIEIHQEGIVRKDTFNIQMYKPEIVGLFNSDTSIKNWSSDSWGIEYDSSIKRFVLSDSPAGKYKDSSLSICTLLPTIDLTDFISATLEFKSSWNFERFYDCVVLEAKSVQNGNWERLTGNRMMTAPKLNNSRLKQGEQGYTGHSPFWLHNECSLDKYIGKIIEIRFVLLSDGNKNFNGIRFSEIGLRLYKELSGTSDSFSYPEYEYSFHPNPVEAGSDFTFEFNSFKLPFSDNIQFKLVNPIGQTIFEENRDRIINQKHIIQIPTTGLAAGCYFAILNYGGRAFINKIIIF
ncbi:MAG: type sorting protein [Ignavibacteria bacterium]|nr:type sorting protein [Ignavibacteria bacterium]